MATGAANTALLENISVNKDNFFITDGTDRTKSLKFQLEDTDGGIAHRTITMPDSDINLGNLTATSLTANSITEGNAPVNISTAGDGTADSAVINIGDTDNSENINIGPGTSTGTIVIGNTGSTLVDVNALAINIDSDTGTTSSNKGTRIEGAYNFAISHQTTTSDQSVTDNFKINDSKSAYFVLHIIADDGGSSPFSFFIRGLVKNNSTDTSLVFSNSRETRGTIPTGADVQVTGNDGSDNLSVTCTGPTTTDTIQWRGLITFYTADTEIHRAT